ASLVVYLRSFTHLECFSLTGSSRAAVLRPVKCLLLTQSGHGACWVEWVPYLKRGPQVAQCPRWNLEEIRPNALSLSVSWVVTRIIYDCIRSSVGLVWRRINRISFSTIDAVKRAHRRGQRHTGRRPGDVRG